MIARDLHQEMGGYKSVLLLVQISLVTLCSGRRSDSEFFLNTDAFSADQSVITSNRLRELMHTRCLSDRILVTFRRTELLKMGILPEQLTLDRSECNFTANRTHYRTAVVFSGPMCGASFHIDPLTYVHIINSSVVVTPPTPHQPSQQIDLDDEQGDGLSTSGSGDGEEMEQVLDLHIISLPFVCEYASPSRYISTTPYRPPTSSRVHNSKLRSQTNDSFIIEIFKDGRLLNALKGKASVTVGSTLYLQIKPNPSSHHEKAFIDSCYYKMEERTTPDAIVYLIRNGCPLDPSVTFRGAHNEGERVYSFKIHNLQDVKASLHCDLQPCSLHLSRQSHLPQCGSQMSYCASSSPAKGELISISWPHLLQITGLFASTEYITRCGERTVDAPCDCLVQAGRKTHMRLWLVIVIAFASFCGGACSVLLLWLVCAKTKAKLPPHAQSNVSHPTVHSKLMNQTTTSVSQAM